MADGKTTGLAGLVLALALTPALCAAGDLVLDREAAAKGATTYQRFCVSCHGPTGKGDGPLSHDLRVAVPKLTDMASRNDGKYPYDRVTRIVTTAEIVRGHGTVEMPAWGDAFRRTEGTGEPTIEAAIRNINHYLWTLQDPPKK